MDGTQHARVRGAVVDKDDGRWESECASDDLNEEDEGDGEPNQNSGCLGWRRGRGWDDGEVGSKGVSEREEAETVAEATSGAQFCADFGIDKELQ